MRLTMPPVRNTRNLGSYCKVLKLLENPILYMKKAKPDIAFRGRTKFVHGLLALLLLGLVSISLELPQLFKLNLGPRASARQDYDWNLRTKIEVKLRPEARELKEREEIARSLRTRGLEGAEQVADNLSVPGLEHINGSVQEIQNKLKQSLQQRNLLNATGTLEKSPNLELLPGHNSNGGQATQQRKGRKGSGVLSLRKAAQLAWKAGRRAWKEAELELASSDVDFSPMTENKTETPCPPSIIMNGEQIEQAHHFMRLPCGLTVGSSITIVGKPRPPYLEYKPSIRSKNDDGSPTAEISQFVFELHGINESEYEEPPRILHINPRLKGDWSNKPVIEQNTCYRGQWGRSQRCDGSRSPYHDTVEGLLKCEKWWQGEQEGNEPSWWLQRFIGRKEKPDINWPYPFAEDRDFILTVRAGLEGYHMSVDGRHVTSFPYSTGLLDEEAAATFVGGNVHLQSIIATSLPSSPPKSLNEKIFENWELWRAPKLPEGSVDLFIGILSASNHFAERMAVRSTWFQSEPIQSSQVVARFFVGMHPNRDINLQMKKEAEYYGDMVILPFMDDYQLVVLKTIAICEYGVQNVSTNYIMKCDDDTFVRVEAVLSELKRVDQEESLYLGNMNMFHKPLRTGKWAVTFEEWPDEEYPTYANGPGYIISRNIASFIISRHKRRTLELFKMEDVSMGLWVKQFHHTTESVQYVHLWKFYQAGCENGYITAHYQSARQMLCMWNKLLKGEVQCCNSNR